MEIRPEALDDAVAVRSLNRAAFGRDDEADIVDRLRTQATGYLALVAVADGDLVGHIAFSRVTMDPPADELSAVGLAPMAVAPERQREGIGSALVTAGIETCRQAKHDAIFVLGHPTYYPRFGFATTAPAIRDDYGAPPEAFMALELTPGALEGIAGRVLYDPALAE